MNKKISATLARIHFGELMDEAQSGPVIVERDGIPKIVILSKQHYDELIHSHATPDWDDLVREAHNHVREDLAGKSLPHADEIIRQLREERNEQLDGLR